MQTSKQFKNLLIVSCVLFISALFNAVQAADVTRQIKDILGVTHVSGKYYFTTNDFLNEGADEIAALGTSVIKLWLNSTPAVNYPWNSNWSQYSFSNMVELVQTPYYQNVINRTQFKTIIFETTEFPNTLWNNGVTSNEAASCRQHLYDLTKYLLTNYAGSGKTFILQNWEGDNALNFDTVTNETDRATRTQGMIDWLNARQDGITQARNEVGMTNGVQVFGAAEVNQIPVYKTFNYPLAVDSVLPYLHMDLYSYSDWSTKSAGTEYQLPAILDYLKAKAPPSGYFGEDNIYMGEFGCYEMSCLGKTIDSHTTESDRVHREIVGKQLELALKWGVRYIVYWEVYCNGLRDGHTNSPAAESDLVGVWLRRPDGSYTGAHTYFKNIMPLSLTNYLGIYEAENQTNTVSAGDTETEFGSSDLSGYYGSKLEANATNDFIQYTLYVPAPGTYTVSIRHKKSSDRGIFQASINGRNFGTNVDCYASGSGYETVKVGSVNISIVGDKNFKFTVTGKNNASSGYNLALDYIRLTQTDVYEAEDEVTTVSTDDSYSVLSDTELSGGYGSLLTANAENDYIQYKLYVPDPGAYTVWVRYQKSPAYGIFQASIEGYDFGSTVDCYSATSGYVTANLGTVNVSTSGYKKVKFTVTGKNPSSSGYNLAFDYIDLSNIPRDMDSDGLPDWWEDMYFGGPAHAYPLSMAANGINTLYETYLAGLDPTSTQSRLTVSASGFGAANTIRWQSATGRTYSVYWSSNLLNGFTLLNSNVTQNIFTDTVHGAGQSGFYRIGVRLN